MAHFWCAGRAKRAATWFLAFLSIAGCGHVPPATYVRYADLAVPAATTGGGPGQLMMQAIQRGNPVIIEFQPGDRIPLDFSFSGEGFGIEPQHPPLAIVAQKHVFLRIGKDGFRTAFDPSHFDDNPRRPGTFRLGFGVERGKGPAAVVSVVGPER